MFAFMSKILKTTNNKENVEDMSTVKQVNQEVVVLRDEANNLRNEVQQLRNRVNGLVDELHTLKSEMSRFKGQVAKDITTLENMSTPRGQL